MKELWTALFFEAILKLSRPLPDALRTLLLRGLGKFFGLFPHAHKKAVQFNNRLLFRLHGRELAKRTSAIFQNFALTLYDFATPQSVQVDVPRQKELKAWRDKYGGMMLLTFHMGQWELGARLLSQWGWPVTAIFQPYTNPHLKKTIESRRAPGIEFIPVGKGASAAVTRALKEKRLVAMLGDHAFGEDGISVNLMGHSVKWAKGPILLAVRAQVPIVVACIARVGQSRYRTFIEDIIIPAEKSQMEVQRLAQWVADKFADFLKNHPAQWYYFAPLKLMPPATPHEMREKETESELANV